MANVTFQGGPFDGEMREVYGQAGDRLIYPDRQREGQTGKTATLSEFHVYHLQRDKDRYVAVYAGVCQM